MSEQVTFQKERNKKEKVRAPSNSGFEARGILKSTEGSFFEWKSGFTCLLSSFSRFMKFLPVLKEDIGQDALNIFGMREDAIEEEILYF